jgi:hypothetical protein
MVVAEMEARIGSGWIQFGPQLRHCRRKYQAGQYRGTIEGEGPDRESSRIGSGSRKITTR